MLYKAVVKAVLLYGCEISVMIESMMTVMEGFHRRVDVRLAGLTSRQGDDGEWEWRLVVTALEVTRLWNMQE